MHNALEAKSVLNRLVVLINRPSGHHHLPLDSSSSSSKLKYGLHAKNINTLPVKESKNVRSIQLVALDN